MPEGMTAGQQDSDPSDLTVLIRLYEAWRRSDERNRDRPGAERIVEAAQIRSAKLADAIDAIILGPGPAADE